MDTIAPTRQPSASPQLAIVVGVSVLLHVPLLALLGAVEPDDSPIASTTFDASSELVVNVVQEPEEKKKEDDPETEEDNTQVVSAALPEKEVVPEKARFLDRVASKTEEETVRKAAPGAPPVSTPARPSVRQNRESEQQRPEEAARRDDAEIEKEENQSPADDGKSGEIVRETTREADLARDVPVPKSGGEMDPRNFFPNAANTRYVNPRGEGGELDYLKDVAEGDKTLLNRKRTRYWAFFDRVKVQIADQWSPASEYRRRDPHGNVFGVKDRYSAVRVTLNGDGSVRKLYISRPSGLEFYDDEAVRSIRAAAPFHNPPEGLKDEDGFVHFTFGFYFEITQGPTLRIFN